MFGCLTLHNVSYSFLAMLMRYSSSACIARCFNATWCPSCERALYTMAVAPRPMTSTTTKPSAMSAPSPQHDEDEPLFTTMLANGEDRPMWLLLAHSDSE